MWYIDRNCLQQLNDPSKENNLIFPKIHLFPIDTNPSLTNNGESMILVHYLALIGSHRIVPNYTF